MPPALALLSFALTAYVPPDIPPVPVGAPAQVTALHKPLTAQGYVAVEMTPCNYGRAFEVKVSF